MRQDWDKRKIGEICEVLNGFAFKSSEYVENGIRVIRITNVQKGFVVDDDPKYYPMTAKESIKSYLLNSGDLLMSLTGNVGRVGVLQKEMLPAALNQRVACLRIKDKRVLLKYLFHNLNSPIFEQDCINSASGVAQKNMSTEWLKKYLIGIPPIAEQEKIVAELDCLTGIIEKKKQQLEELYKLAQSIFYDMFGDPITNEKGWKVKKLKDVSTLLNGRAYKQDELLPEGKYKVLRVGNFFTNGDYYYSNLELDDDKYCDTGDLLFAWSASFGAFIWDGGKVIYHYHIWKVLYDDKFLNILYYRYLLNTMTSSFMKDVHGIGMVHLTKAGMEQYSLPIPPLELQNAFAQKIEAMEKQKELIKKSIQETETLFNSRMDYWFN